MSEWTSSPPRRDTNARNSEQVVGRELRNAGFGSILPHDVPHDFLRHTGPQAAPALLTRRKTLPIVIVAASVHRSRTALTQSGMGIVRVWPALPRKSMIASAAPAAGCDASRARPPPADAGRTPATPPGVHDHVYRSGDRRSVFANAPRRKFIVPGARLRDSRCMRYRSTTVRLN